MCYFCAVGVVVMLALWLCRVYWCCVCRGYVVTAGVVVVLVPHTEGVLHRSAAARVSSGLPYPALDS